MKVNGRASTRMLQILERGIAVKKKNGEPLHKTHSVLIMMGFTHYMYIKEIG